MIEFVVIGLVVLCASCLQGSIGFGLGMIAAPLLVLVRPDLIPTTIILLAINISVFAFLRERHNVDWSMVLWGSIGRIPGIIAGTIAVATFSQTGLSLTLASIVLIGVAFSLIGWKPAPHRRNVVVAGLFSGLFGTSTGIGGPPIALVMRSVEASAARATISAYFVVGSLMSLTGLAIGRQLTLTHVAYAAAWAPFMIVGIALSSIVIKRASTRALHALAAGVAVLGALFVIGQALVS
ncbi:sulfite exporter TauE/SafE family protein [Brevibacterium yomogidense]|uniref:sulfite exporter TauE/SafE family protein n=1 Tax=Brevibacterium yomogidense TaxID=946573 RepID=UPI0018DF78B9